MIPFIISIDKTKPIGKLIADYGDYQWNNGFIVGFISGAACCLLFYII